MSKKRKIKIEGIEKGHNVTKEYCTLHKNIITKKRVSKQPEIEYIKEIQ